jgi:outer membrane protein
MPRVLDSVAMKRLIPLVLVAALAMVLLTSTLTAQPESNRLVFVDSQALIAAHPAGQEASELRIRAQTEVNEIREQLEGIQSRARAGQTLTNEETERFNILITTLESVQTRYQAEIAAAAGPAIEAVNAAIREISVEQGYGIVFDIGAAADSGLVVYAADGLDITDAVMVRLGN